MLIIVITIDHHFKIKSIILFFKINGQVSFCLFFPQAGENNQTTLITSSLYLSSQGLIVCGRKDGSIVVINAVKAALNQLLEANHTTKTG